MPASLPAATESTASLLTSMEAMTERPLSCLYPIKQVCLICLAGAAVCNPIAEKKLKEKLSGPDLNSVEPQFGQGCLESFTVLPHFTHLTWRDCSRTRSISSAKLFKSTVNPFCEAISVVISI